MADFHFALRWAHIILGISSLVAFWVSSFTKKGSRRHIRLGRVFAWLSYASLATALPAALWCLLAPRSYLGDNSASAQVVADAQFFMVLVGYGGISLFASIQLGISLVTCKNQPVRLKRQRHLFPQWLVSAACVGLILYGALNFGPGTNVRYMLPIIAGASGILMTLYNLWFVWLSHERADWWAAKHVETMILAGITSHVAPAVVIGVRLARVGWLSPTHTPWVLTVAALVPCVIGLSVLCYLLRKYNRTGYPIAGIESGAMST